MVRRYDRSNARLPVELVATLATGRVEQPGSVMDLSKRGLRIQTCPCLIPGQRVEVFLMGRTRVSVSCRVVWAHTKGFDRPCEAGLEILAEAPVMGNSSWDFLGRTREVRESPAIFG